MLDHTVLMYLQMEIIYTVGHDYGWGENYGHIYLKLDWHQMTSAGVVSKVKVIKPQSISSNYDDCDACQVDSQGNVWTLGIISGSTERKVVIAMAMEVIGALISM